MKGKILRNVVFIVALLALINGVSRLILGRVSINTFWYHVTDVSVLGHSGNLIFVIPFVGALLGLGWGLRKTTSYSVLIGLLWIALLSILFYPALYLSRGGTTPSQFQPFFPQKETIISPKDKKNLIFIFAESLENTYQDETVFGENLIPRLSSWTENNTHFKHFVQLNGTEFTSGAYVSMLCGLPLFVDLATTLKQHPVCVPNILKDSGYHMTFLKGAHIKFGRTHQIAQFMEFDKALGYEELIAEGRITSADIGFKKWMLTMPPDRKLFQIAEEEIDELAKTEPFLMVITTADTHFPMGYLDMDCPSKNGDMRDIISCTDDTLGDFLEKLKSKPFYKDTLIVLLGDHLSMKNNIFSQLLSAQERGIYNLFIHAPSPPKTSRTFTSFDIAPTLLEMLGFKVPVLGYGKSLMRDTPTLIEGAPEDFEEFLALGKPIKNQSGFYKGKQGIRNAQSPKTIQRIRRKIGRRYVGYP